MSEALQLATAAGGVDCGSSDAVRYIPAATCALVSQSAEADAMITYQTDGSLLSLQVNKLAGNRTGGAGMHVVSNIAGSEGALHIDFTTTNGQYEDVADTDAVGAGQTVSWKTKAGGSGNANLNLSVVGGLWSATGTTTCHFAATHAGLAYPTASQTSYLQPSCAAAIQTTKAKGQWKCRLPAGVANVTAKNMEVRVSGNTRTTATTFTSDGATGAGTAPNVSISGAGAQTLADTTHSILLVDTDLFSTAVVTGNDASHTLTLTFVAIEIASTNNVFHLIGGTPAGAAVASSGDCFQVAGGLQKLGSGSEANLKVKSELTASTVTLTNLAVYTTGQTGTWNYTLRKNAVATALTLALGGSGTWSENIADSVTTVSPDLLSNNIANGSFVPTLWCTALTVQNTVPAALATPAPVMVLQAVNQAANY